jgi:hypothetical protein
MQILRSGTLESKMHAAKRTSSVTYDKETGYAGACHRAALRADPLARNDGGALSRHMACALSLIS